MSIDRRLHHGPSPDRWSADRELTLEMVKSEVDDQFPELRPVHAEYVGSGWDYDAYRVNRDWLFRFPRRSDVDEAVEPAMAVVAALPDLPGVEIPRPVKRGRPGARFPYRFFAHRWIAGCGADELAEDQLDRSGLSTMLGAALSTLHGTDLHALTALGVPCEQEGPRETLGQVVDRAPLIRQALPVELTERCEPFLVGDVAGPPEYAGPTRLLHNDIGIEHLIVDPANGLLVGIIDWEDTSLGDPALDFVGLFCWQGAGFVEQVLRHYSLTLDAGFHTRLRILARVHSLEWLGTALVQYGPDSLHQQVAWVRQAFRA